MTEDKEPEKAGKLVWDEAPMSEDEIDLNLVETFPASDPPSWTLGTDHQNESQAEQNGAENETED